MNFYFRFVAPFREDLEQGYLDRAWKAIDQQLSSYVGLIGFEELCRQWVCERGRQDYLPTYLERVGSYWDRHTQVDVVGMNWSEQTALLGEAKWTTRAVGMQALDRLQEKTSAVVPKGDWHVHYALFSRSGFTEALRVRAESEGVLLVDWGMMLAAMA